MLKRIIKMLGAQGAGVSFGVITQLVLPPVFILYYGVANYGEWLVLSATLSYLSTINFGITTYAGNELTIVRQRGDLDLYRRLQASTLAFLLSLLAVGILCIAAIAMLPIADLLHLHFIGQRDAELMVWLLGLQMLCHILGGYFNNLFMVVQKTHRGSMWASWRNFVPAVVAIPCAVLRTSFVTIAFTQFIAVAVTTFATILDLKWCMPDFSMSVKGANWRTTKDAIVPSGMFGLIFTQQFLLFQVPVIILQRLLGPEVVVLFTICRTVFSMARRMLSMLTNAIAPEITFSFGSGDHRKLLDIFHYSERVVFSLIPVANLGTFLFAPLLVRLWLHKPGLFDLWIYSLMALVSGVMSMREHKQYFQFATNTHHRLAHIVFWGNLVMIGVSVPVTVRFGLRGFMITWLVSESTQMALLYFENKKLFHSDSSISMVPVLKLGLLMGLALPVCMVVVSFSRQHGQALQAGIGAVGTAALFAICYWLFGLNVVQRWLTSRFSNRPASVA